ncbi:20923_t:CDS:1, partial [Dentiscutata erythropus]
FRHSCTWKQEAIVFRNKEANIEVKEQIQEQKSNCKSKIAN